MLLLSRKVGEKIMIGDDITLVVVEVVGNKVRVGIEAPRTVPIHRAELLGELDQRRQPPKESGS